MRAMLIASFLLVTTAHAQRAHICDEPRLDLDGDGVLDRFEEVAESRGTGGAQYRVFHGDRMLGVIDACWIRLAPTASHGLSDLITVWRLGANEAIETRWRYDGHRYRETSSRRCASQTCE